MEGRRQKEEGEQMKVSFVDFSILEFYSESWKVVKCFCQILSFRFSSFAVERRKKEGGKWLGNFVKILVSDS